jgi:iron complex outermembrane receptor protein
VFLGFFDDVSQRNDMADKGGFVINSIAITVRAQQTGEVWNRNPRSGRALWVALLAPLILCFGVSAPVAAQQTSPAAGTSIAPDASPSDKLEEIIVTAAKQAEPLSRTPIAVSVQSQEQLQNAGVVILQDMTASIPSIQFDTQGFNNNVQASIRGITSSEGGEIAQSAVATYIDGVYVPRTSAISGVLFDLERVEVLRGPQGTLYGMNATAGNINIITADPAQKFEASTEVGAGNYGDIETRGMLNLPISSTLALRGAFVYHQNNGYIDTEQTTVQNYARADDRAVRLTGLWQPSDTFKWKLSIDEFYSNGTPNFNVVTAANGSPANGLSPYRFPVSGPEPQDYQHNSAVRSRIDWQIGGGLSLAYIAGLAHADYGVITEWAAIPNPLGFQHSDTTNHNEYEEVNLIYDSDRLRNVLGANYSQESNDDFFNNPLPSLNDINLIIDSNAGYSSWGMFDQLTYRVADGLRLTAGVRYSKDHQEYPAKEIICGLNTLFFGGPLPAGCTVSPYSSGEGDWSKVNWKAGVEYDLSNSTLSYLTVSTGYKAGGLNASGGAQPDSQFKPEDVTNFELGLKTRLLDDRASLNIALFYEDYTNLQVNQFVNLAFLTENAAKAANYGTEIEGRWQISPQDHLEGFVTYLHATYKEYNNAVDQNTNINYPSLSGNTEPNAPRESLRGQYSHDFAVAAGGKLTPSAAVYWQARSYLREFNLPIDLVPAYSKTTLRLSYVDSSERWKTEAYVNNLENNAVRNGELLFLGQYYSYYNPPRTFGLRLSYTY